MSAKLVIFNVIPAGQDLADDSPPFGICLIIENPVYKVTFAVCVKIS